MVFHLPEGSTACPQPREKQKYDPGPYNTARRPLAGSPRVRPWVPTSRSLMKKTQQAFHKERRVFFGTRFRFPALFQ